MSGAWRKLIHEKNQKQKSRDTVPFKRHDDFNPFLHNVWLDNHALTLKINTTKYVLFSWKIQFLAYPPKILSSIKENLSQILLSMLLY